MQEVRVDEQLTALSPLVKETFGTIDLMITYTTLVQRKYGNFKVAPTDNISDPK